VVILQHRFIIVHQRLYGLLNQNKAGFAKWIRLWLK
jgi:hypothetical protein